MFQVKASLKRLFVYKRRHGMDHFRHNHRLEHSVMDPDGDHQEDEHDHVPEDEERLRGHEVGEESLGEGV